MVRSIGFVYAALAALGHSGIDATRKLGSQKLNPTELVALVGVLDAFFLTIVVLSLKLVPNSTFFTWPLIRILVTSSAVKILAGVMYQRALQVAPLSSTVPYLAFVPAFILVTGFLLLHEMPSVQGIAGVCIVTLGGFLLALNNSKAPPPGAKKGSTSQLLTRDNPSPSKPLLGDSSSGGSSASAAASAAQAEAESEFGIAAGMVVGLPSSPSTRSQSTGQTSSTAGTGTMKQGTPINTPLVRSRLGQDAAASVTSSSGAGGGNSISLGAGLPASRPRSEAPASRWDFSPQNRSRWGMGLGFGIGPGATQREKSLESGESISLTSDGEIKGAKAPFFRRAKEAFLGTEKGDGWNLRLSRLFPFRFQAFSATSWIKARAALLSDTLKSWGLEEGTVLMLLCAVCLSLTNGIDKLGLHASPSVLVFAWLQRLFMGFPPAAYLVLSSPGSYKHLLRHFPILSAVSFFEIVAIVFYLKSIEWLLVSYAVAAKRINILVSVLVGYFVFRENIWRRLPYILLMMAGMLLVIFAPQ